MGISLKRVALILLVIVFSIIPLTQQVFAVPNSPDTPENSLQSPENPENSTGNENEDEYTENTTENEEQGSTCYDEVGGIGWLVCPGTSFLARVIDGAYGILETLIAVDPISQDNDSPVHIVWDYLRNIANLGFIIVFLIIIYSQLTGYGLNNYGIKRMLPRLVIAAILLNLSYIICSAAVDLSNILGFNLRNVFAQISEDAITNGTISSTVQNFSVAGVVATILGVGTTGVITTLAFAGGWTGLIWLLIPIILSGVVAVVSALITMAARQALITLLVMISPLAIIAYLLPNTESWFRRWLQLFTTMIFFFPMFSILYGASNLAGLVMISSADSWLSAILGIAVMILPLFMTIPLLRMSGTILGRIDGAIKRTTAPATRLAGNYAQEKRLNARNNFLRSNSARPSASLARFLEQNRHNRMRDLKEGEDVLREAKEANYRRSHYDYNGRLNRRGYSYYEGQQTIMHARNAIAKFDTDMDEGFDENDARVRRRDRAKITAVNEGYKTAIADAAINTARQRVVTMNNLQDRAENIQKGLKDANSTISQQVADSFNYQILSPQQLANLSSSQRKAYDKATNAATNAVLADAIAAKRKVDNEAKSNYLELYNDSPAGPAIGKQLTKAFDDMDYNSMDAALEVMGKRGDWDQINEIITKQSGKIANNQLMQKHLADSLIGVKGDYASLGAYAKALMMRRGMHEAGKQIAEYISFADFDSGTTNIPGDLDANAVQKVMRQTLMEGMNDTGLGKTQDKNFFKDLFKKQVDGVYSAGDMVLSEKQFRSALLGGTIDGEKLDALNMALTGGHSKANRDQSEINFFNQNSTTIKDYALKMLRYASASQLVNLKSGTITAINEMLLDIDPSNAQNVNGHRVSTDLYNVIDNQRSALNKPNATGLRSNMNPVVREMLDIKLN